MSARPLALLPLLLAFSLAGCIKESEWHKYNHAPGAPCSSDEECTSCPVGATWECTGPPGDQGICPARRQVTVDGVTSQMGICRMSLGEPGMNCSSATVDFCDYANCVWASSQEQGVCSRTCDDGFCPDRSVCTTTNKTGGGVMNWCAQTCKTDADCDTNATCETLSSGGQVCFPQ